MSGTFAPGEIKTRPGNYVRYENAGANPQAAVIAGVVAAAFQADWGPIGVVREIASVSEGEAMYGKAGRTEILSLIKRGGATKIKAVRVGTGGTKGTLTLKDTTSNTAVDVVTLTAKYEGARALSATVRDSLTDTTKREVIFYSGTLELQRITFAKGSGEVDAIVAAVNATDGAVATAVKAAAGSGTLAAVTQSAFAGGADPVIANSDYSAAFTLLESEKWNVLALDTSDAAVHTLANAYIKRVRDAGMFVMGVVGQLTNVALATRMGEAAALNNEAMVYVLNGFYDSGSALMDGYKAAAVIAGMVAATASNQSLTHSIIPGAVSIAGALTNTQIEACILGGALALTSSQTGGVWIESAINTLVTPAANQDVGWKKIRRTKTRYELLNRIIENTDPITGKVDNDENGRATVLAVAQGVINAMISEGKLVSGSASEDSSNVASGDSAWFTLSVIDKDSIEKTYWTFRFQFGGQ